MKSTEFLQAAIDVQTERAKEYDSPEGERSMGRTVAAFNAVTGRDLTEAEGWLFLQTLKDVRQWSAKGYHHDSALDGVSYSSLKAEALCQGAKPGVEVVGYRAEPLQEFDPTDPRQWMAGDFLMGRTGAMFVLVRVDGHLAVLDNGEKAHLSSVSWFSRPEAKPMPVAPGAAMPIHLWLPGDVLQGSSGTEYVFQGIDGAYALVTCKDEPDQALLSNLLWVRRP